MTLTPEQLVARLDAELAPLPVSPRLRYQELQARSARRRSRRRRGFAGTAALTLLAAAAVVVTLVAVRPSSPGRASVTPVAPLSSAAGGSGTAVPSVPESVAAPVSPSASPGLLPVGTAAGIDDEQFGDGVVSNGVGAVTSYVGQPLVRRTFQGGSVEVPAGWVETNATLPSDHSDYLFYDPANPTARFEVSESGCVGCASKGGDGVTPDPGGPPATVSSVALPGGRSVAFTEKPWLGYAVNGVDVILTGAQNGGPPSDTGSIAGYALYRVALPMDDTALETTILNSVHLT